MWVSIFCRCVVLPIIREFNPDMILVSAGFNATEGHPNTLGGYSVTPACEFIVGICPSVCITILLIVPYRLWSSHSYVNERGQWQGCYGTRGRVRNYCHVPNEMFHVYFLLVAVMSSEHYVLRQSVVSELCSAMRYVTTTPPPPPMYKCQPDIGDLAITFLLLLC